MRAQIVELDRRHLNRNGGAAFERELGHVIGLRFASIPTDENTQWISHGEPLKLAPASVARFIVDEAWRSNRHQIGCPTRADSTSAATSPAVRSIKSFQDWPCFCRLTCRRGYHGLSGRWLNQYQVLPVCGTNSTVGLPNAPARCAVVLLTVTTRSHALIRDASPSISFMLSMSSSRSTTMPVVSLSASRSASVSPYCRSINRHPASCRTDWKSLRRALLN